MELKKQLPSPSQSPDFPVHEYGAGKGGIVLALAHRNTGSPSPWVQRGDREKLLGGFSFIEMLLYVGIIAIVMGSLIPAAWQMISGETESNANSETYAQMRKISERIKYEIRNASGINSVAATSISLASATAGNNPTVIDLSGQFLRIKQGAGAVINLNSPDSSISGLVFSNHSSLDGKTKNIQFTFTINQNYNTVRQEYTGSSSVEGDAEIRSN